MPELNKANGSHTQTKAIVLFGLSDEGKPQAGLFAEPHAALAKKVAKALGQHCAGPSGAVAKLTAGRLVGVDRHQAR